MKYSFLGRTGIRVSQVSLGTATFGASPQEADAIRLVGRALDLGVNFFDTANSYGVGSRWDRPGGPSAEERRSAEEILGRAIKGRRSEALIATKVGETVGMEPNGGGLSRLQIMQQVEVSLRRLDTDYLDIYYAHRPDPNTAIDETVEAFNDLIHQGKIRYYGFSNFPAWRLMEGLWACQQRALRPPSCVQALYNLTSRTVETEILPAVRSQGLSMVAYSPLANGLLAGAATLGRPVSGKERWGGPAFTEVQKAQCLQMDAVARDAGLAPSRLALAWLLAQQGVVSTIIGSERIESLEESCSATDLALPDDLRQALDGIASLS